MKIRALFAAVAIVGVSGCAQHVNRDVGAIAGEEGVVDVVEVLHNALGEGDGARACSLMDRAAQVALIDRTGGEGDCPTAVQEQASGLSDETRQSLSEVQVEVELASDVAASARVIYDGDAAVDAESVLGSDTLQLVRSEGRWTVAEVIVQG